MITINGYKEVKYPDFQKALHFAWADSEKTYLQIASQINVLSVLTAQNAFKTDKQIVSDEVLTNVMKAVNLSGFVIWIFGVKYYYIKNK